MYLGLFVGAVESHHHLFVGGVQQNSCVLHLQMVCKVLHEGGRGRGREGGREGGKEGGR